MTYTKIAEYDGITEYKFDSNDLKLPLAPRRAAPVVAFMVLYRVGSRNEAVGHTGSTRLLEHVLFKGAPETITELVKEILKKGGDQRGGVKAAVVMA